MLKNLLPVTVVESGPVIASDKALPAISVPVTVKVTPETSAAQVIVSLHAWSV